MGHLRDNKWIFPRILFERGSNARSTTSGEVDLLGMFCNDGSAGLQPQDPVGHQGNLWFKNHMYTNSHGGLNSKRFSSNKKKCCIQVIASSLVYFLVLAFCRKWECPAVARGGLGSLQELQQIHLRDASAPAEP